MSSQTYEPKERSLSIDNLLLTVNEEHGTIFISTHGTFYKGSLPVIIDFLNGPGLSDEPNDGDGADNSSD